jgi:hypothetical protein
MPHISQISTNYLGAIFKNNQIREIQTLYQNSFALIPEIRGENF